MKIQTLCSLALLALAPFAPAQDDTTPVDPGLRIVPSGVEAPTQPNSKSSAEVIRSPRFAPVSNRPVLPVNSAPIGSLVVVRGQRDNHVMNIGLVTGLAGTGDSGDAAKQLLQNLLKTRNITLDLQTLSSKNIAVVRVEADLPAGIKSGLPIDVRVSTIGDAKSLEGGTLAMTELTDVTGQTVFVTASGPITVGGFTAGGEGATVTRNHVTVGTMPGGGMVEREVPTQIVSDHGYIYLNIKLAHDTFGNVVNIAERINGMYNGIYAGIAIVTPDGKTVRVQVPQDIPKHEHVAFLSKILSLEVQSENLARVIINERTGLIVMGGDVRLRPGAITHANLTVTIAESPETSQPGAFSGGQTKTQDRTAVEVEEDDNALVLEPGASTLQDVVDVLNLLGTAPRDMITILQGMSQSGLLVADIKRM